MPRKTPIKIDKTKQPKKVAVKKLSLPRADHDRAQAYKEWAAKRADKTIDEATGQKGEFNGIYKEDDEEINPLTPEERLVKRIFPDLPSYVYEGYDGNQKFTAKHWLWLHPQDRERILGGSPPETPVFDEFGE